MRTVHLIPIARDLAKLAVLAAEQSLELAREAGPDVLEPHASAALVALRTRQLARRRRALRGLSSLSAAAEGR